MKRVYTSTAHFRAPFKTPNISFAGLGSARQWPAGRSYYDVSNYRAPYDDGYYGSGALRGPTTPWLQWRALGVGVAVAASAGLLLGEPGKRLEDAKFAVALGGLGAFAALWASEGA